MQWSGTVHVHVHGTISMVRTHNVHVVLSPGLPKPKSQFQILDLPCEAAI